MRRTTCLLAIVALVLASCGGDTEESDRAEATSPGASASALATTGSLTASPTPGLATDYEVPRYEVPPFAELEEMYAYDTSEPLGFEELAKERQGKATVYMVEYQSSGYAVPAYLVIPDGQGPFPAVLYAHGYTMTERYYLDDAVALAQEGYAGLLIEYPHVREPGVEYFSWDARSDVEGFEQYVIDLRRGIDLLESLPGIDAGRIGFVGHSIGGWVGSILSGVEDRIDAYVLTAVGSYGSAQPEGSGFAAPLPEGDELAEYQEGMVVVYPVNYVGHSRGAVFLFQASKADEIVSLGNIQALFEAAPEPKTLRWYAGPQQNLPLYEHHHLGCERQYWAMATLGDYQGCPPSLPAFVFHRDWLEENV